MSKKSEIQRFDLIKEEYAADVATLIDRLSGMPRIFRVFKFICSEMGVPVEEALLPSRKRRLAYPRFIFAGVLMIRTEMALDEIASLIRSKPHDHTSVLHAKEVISGWKDTKDPNYALYKRALQLLPTKYGMFDDYMLQDDWNDSSLPVYDRALRGVAIVEIIKGVPCQIITYSDGSGLVVESETNTLILEFSNMPDLVNEISIMISDDKTIDDSKKSDLLTTEKQNA